MENLLQTMSPDERQKLVAKVQKRFTASSTFYDTEREDWRQFYKVYHRIKDDSESTDELNILVPLAWGFIEDSVASLAPTFLQKLAVIPKPKRARDHTSAASKFFDMCKDYLTRADYKLERISNDRERLICGSAWEADDWANDYDQGFRWANAESQEEQDIPLSYMGRALRSVRQLISFRGPKKVPHQYPRRIGYVTRFPSIFNVYPEPGPKKVDDMSWIIELQYNVALEDLEARMYFNPETGRNEPVYDLSQLLDDVQGDREKIRPCGQFTEETIDIEQDISGKSSKDGMQDNDTPAVNLAICRERNCIIVIANGKYLIQVLDRPWDKPGLKMRLKHAVQDSNRLYGHGFIEPVEDLLFVENQTYNMAMQNWFKIINRMVAYDEEMVKHPDDFSPRALGRIRLTVPPGKHPANAIIPIDHDDVTNSMLAMSSNNRGLIERTNGAIDYTPGTSGTKAYHKTYGGLMEIQQAVARRFGLIYLQDMASLQQQMDEIYWMHEQFMWTPLSFSISDSRGVMRAETYVREDIETDGLGFVMVQTDDPSFGDSTVQRNQSMILFDLIMRYEEFRRTTKDPTLMEARLDVALKEVLEKFGRTDVSKLLTEPDGSIDPDDEYTAIIQGAVVMPNPRENLSAHLIRHVIKRNSPEFREGIKSGRLPGEVALILDKHIQATMEFMQMILQDPEGATQDEVNRQAAGVNAEVPKVSRWDLGYMLPGAAQLGAGGPGMGT